MKRFLGLIIFLLGVAPVWAQGPSGNITRSFNLTVGNPIGPTGTPWISEIGSGVDNHVINWTIQGSLATCSVKVEKSADGITWSDLIAGATCTSNNTGTLTAGNANYVRVNATTITGTGTLKVQYFGFVPGLPSTSTVSGTVDVACLSGCSAGTSDSDDGTIASGQTIGLVGGLSMVFDGTNWKRLTVGTAGTASAQAVTVQGIASMTPILATLSGTNNIATVTTVSTVTNPVTVTDGSGALNVICDSGCGTGGTSDTDDGSIAVSQSVGLVGGLSMVYDGSVWRRWTIGPAGTPSTQVLTVQGITSMTPLSVTSTTVDSAEGAAVGTTPVPVGCVYRTTFTVLDAGDVGYIACDVNGRIVHAPAPGPLVNGVTSSMTGTTSTSVVSGTASNYLYITSCRFTNTDADTDTAMLLQDGSGGTTLDIVPVPHLTGGAVVTYPTPLKVPTSGNALYTANATTGATTYASCSGFRSTASF